MRPDEWAAEQAEKNARASLYRVGVIVERVAHKALTNKAVWEALRGLVEKS